MEKQTKEQLLQRRTDNLAALIPELRGYFKCPTCLIDIPLNEHHRISIAHIIPEAAGGTLRTFLCRDCNSIFGGKQDKWFGEALRMENEDCTFADLSKDGFFWIDDLKVNGTWWFKDKKLNFFIDTRYNSPEVNRFIQEKKYGKPSQISVPVPFLRNRRYIDIGFLTMAYLMWFEILGYSWVLQKHLEPIRRQILKADDDILDRKFTAYVKNGGRMELWLGVVALGSELALVMGFEKMLVLLPPYHSPDLYAKLEDDFSRYDLNVNNFRPFRFPTLMPVAPLVMVYEERALVVPDQIVKAPGGPVVIRFTQNSMQPDFLFPMPAKDFASRIKTEKPTIISLTQDA